MARIFDSHLHIIDPRFPLTANQGYLPGNFSSIDYLSQAADLKQNADDTIVGGAIVSGSFQAFDQTYLEAALSELGKGFVGVTQLPPDVSTDEIRRLDALGVRAMRCNLFRGGGLNRADLDAFARRVYDVAGWHTELYVDARSLWDPENENLSVLGRTVSNLPAASIDHLGMHPAGLPAILELAQRGVRIKATGFGRLEPRPYGDEGEAGAKSSAAEDFFHIAETLRAIVRANPRALLFGTDLPGTRAPRAFTHDDLALLREALGEFGNDALDRVLCLNALEFYRVEV
ncbi:MAG: amidohydrolase family protein [bacterium]|nr:amidohydrolase family protein [bacterium]